MDILFDVENIEEIRKRRLFTAQSQRDNERTSKSHEFNEPRR